VCAFLMLGRHSHVWVRRGRSCNCYCNGNEDCYCRCGQLPLLRTATATAAATVTATATGPAMRWPLLLQTPLLSLLQLQAPSVANVTRSQSPLFGLCLPFGARRGLTATICPQPSVKRDIVEPQVERNVSWRLKEQAKHYL
jgi:hypothetical protein